MAAPERWLAPELDTAGARRLQAALGLRAPAARILWHRGYRDEEAARLFLTAPLSGIHSPLLLRDMDRAAERLHQAIRNGETILLYGDYDVDGTSAIVILSKAIELAGGRSIWHVPHRLRDGYGMRPEVIDQANAQGVSLIVSVDTGIRAAAVVEHARTLGIDVIVTDHHLPETAHGVAALPPALAVLNPNRPDCGYPEKNLCGAAVAFKLAQALLDRMEWHVARRQRVLESFLKMVAIATVADMVPLTGENRVLVKHGLEGLKSTRNPGLRQLMQLAGVEEGSVPTATQIAFQVAPRINAAGRMASAGEVIELFLTSDPARAQALAEQLNLLNLERRDTEAGIVEPIIQQYSVADLEGQFALVFSAPGWHRGVVGIAASRLVERYSRPVFVLGEEDGVANGSGRSIPQFHLLNALESMADLFTKFGGHRQAAGVTLPASRVAEFRERLAAYARERLTPDDLKPSLALDLETDFRELTDDAVAEVLAMAPFGFGNPKPVAAVYGVEIAAAPELKNERHLFLRLRQGGRLLMAKWWNFAPNGAGGSQLGPAAALNGLEQGNRLDVAFTLEEDRYSASRGFAPWQIVLRAIRPA